MKSNLLHICFVLDESGSMYRSVEDIIGGFKNLIDEQKKVTDGECVVSVYRFSDKVVKDYIGKSVHDVPELVYSPGGCTAMNDGIGTAIDEIGVWLNDMDESQRPSKNLIVIMTDGAENASKEYSFERVKEMIKHQEEKYSWSFVYMGTNLSSLDDAKDLGISMRSVSSRSNVSNNYKHIDNYSKSYRCAKNSMESNRASVVLSSALALDTSIYTSETGIPL